jgi:hypothetical protein
MALAERTAHPAVVGAEPVTSRQLCNVGAQPVNLVAYEIDEQREIVTPILTGWLWYRCQPAKRCAEVLVFLAHCLGSPLLFFGLRQLQEAEASGHGVKE